MQNRRLTKNDDGFTLIELLITMALFIVVIMITANIFEKMLPKTKIITKSEVSNIEGIVGLEMFRRDLEQAGFGLFTDIDHPPPSYTETDSAGYNDAPGGIPRAVVAGNNLTSGVLSGSDYLVIKGTNAALNPASQCWTRIKGLGSSKIWGANDLQENRNDLEDQIVVVNQTYKNGELLRKLIYSPSSFTAPYRANGAAYEYPFAPTSDDKHYYYYGIYSTDSENPAPRAPFNRTDYFVRRVAGDMPDRCSPAAGVLYKSVMNQDKDDSSVQNIPILDCVADMQVVLGWNTSSDPAGNAVDIYTDADGSNPSGSSSVVPDVNDPKEIRTRLKLVKVYLLAQDGGFDKNYTNTDTAMKIGEENETAVTKTVDLTQPNYRNYRWKLYRLVVRPKNLM